MDSFEKLVQMFREFPGIGPRQARRFAFFVVTRNDSFAHDLLKTLNNAKETVGECSDCKRLTDKKGGVALCKICADPTRSKKELLLIAKDTDLVQIEKSGEFKGSYFVLGGLIPLLEREPSRRIRQAHLLSLIEKRKKEGLEEIILALSATNEGENTSEYLREILKDHRLKIFELGRGLSTGSEVEYADAETLKFALKNKK